MLKIYPNDWSIKAASRVMALLSKYLKFFFFLTKQNMIYLNI